ncbi:hypothetical protein [Streptomonospora salina]|uniref:Uncharacterized protein n=1 Tax=Streptomonospora salina TaxID=104205 RepID=A0A841EHN0_9ACTN|nr:hypothetical protein [Streptomonospora salina]MBB5998931.1 hypothetical protein [Streptomonospora salina]
MLDPIPQHPYPSGLAVHDAAETSEEARTRGTARVVTHHPHSDGTFTYVVEPMDGETRTEWASYFTIPAGLWAMPEESGADGRGGADSGPAAQYSGAQAAPGAYAPGTPGQPGQPGEAPEAQPGSGVPSEW